MQSLRELDDAGLVGHRKKCGADTHEVGGGDLLGYDGHGSHSELAGARKSGSGRDAAA